MGGRAIEKQLLYAVHNAALSGHQSGYWRTVNTTLLLLLLSMKLDNFLCILMEQLAYAKDLRGTSDPSTDFEQAVSAQQIEGLC